MQQQKSSTPKSALSSRFISTLALTLVLALSACGSKTNDARAASARRSDSPPPGGPRPVACTIMPKEEMNTITGASYTTAESSDDAHSTGSSCHYSSPTNPAGASVSVSWITARDYSNPVEHAALQKASIGGARLAEKLVGGMTSGGASLPGMPSGPVSGVGDEATFNLMLLTARKGDYTIMVQIIPTNMMSFMTDSTLVIAFAEQEKAIARKVLEKL